MKKIFILIIFSFLFSGCKCKYKTMSESLEVQNEKIDRKIKIREYLESNKIHVMEGMNEERR